MNIEKQALSHLHSAYRVAPLRIAAYLPLEGVTSIYILAQRWIAVWRKHIERRVHCMSELVGWCHHDLPRYCDHLCSLSGLCKRSAPVQRNQYGYRTGDSSNCKGSFRWESSWGCDTVGAKELAYTRFTDSFVLHTSNTNTQHVNPFILVQNEA